jgi:hypothetical protein
MSRRTGKKWLIRGAMQPVTVVVVFFQVLSGSRNVRSRDVAEPGDVSDGREVVTDGPRSRSIGHILFLDAVSLACFSAPFNNPLGILDTSADGQAFGDGGK